MVSLGDDQLQGSSAADSYCIRVAEVAPYSVWHCSSCPIVSQPHLWQRGTGTLDSSPAVDVDTLKSASNWQINSFQMIYHKVLMYCTSFKCKFGGGRWGMSHYKLCPIVLTTVYSSQDNFPLPTPMFLFWFAKINQSHSVYKKPRQLKAVSNKMDPDKRRWRFSSIFYAKI